MSNQDLLEKNNGQAVAARNEFRMMPITEVKGWYDDFVDFSKSILKSGQDYGIIPGTNKPTLYKAGAEKLRFAYGLGVEMKEITNKVDWEHMFVDCTYKAIIRAKNGQVIAECEGNVNSEEPKYKYIWVPESEIPIGYDKNKLKTRGGRISEFKFAIDKSETSGQYGKPAEYWQKFKDGITDGTAKQFVKNSAKGKPMDAYEIDSIQYRVKNVEVVGLKNTMMKMAQKRAFVGAILIATGASEFYTQDVEDMDITGTGYIHSDNEIVADYRDVTDTGAAKIDVTPEQKEVDTNAWIALSDCQNQDDLKDVFDKWKTKVSDPTAFTKHRNDCKAKLSINKIQD
jgi:hypothetical protein